MSLPTKEPRSEQLAKFNYRLAIIKADDLGGEASMDCWWRLLDAMDRRGVPISIGAVANRLQQNSDADLRRLTLLIDAGHHEVWNHSHTHPDFTQLNPEEQEEQLLLSQPVIEAALS